MSDQYRVETISVDGGPTALGSGGRCTVVVDRSPDAGGRGQGFNGGQLLNMAVAACISNDLYREAARLGIELDRVRVIVDSDYVGDPAVSTPVSYQVEASGDASSEAISELMSLVDRIAEIPNSLRSGTVVQLQEFRIAPR